MLFPTGIMLFKAFCTLFLIALAILIVGFAMQWCVRGLLWMMDEHRLRTSRERHVKELRELRNQVEELQFQLQETHVEQQLMLHQHSEEVARLKLGPPVNLTEQQLIQGQMQKYRERIEDLEYANDLCNTQIKSYDAANKRLADEVTKLSVRLNPKSERTDDLLLQMRLQAEQNRKPMGVHALTPDYQQPALKSSVSGMGLGPYRVLGTRLMEKMLYNKQGFDIFGRDRQGYDKEGYNAGGYDEDGYDRDGFDVYGNHRELRIKRSRT